MLLWGYTYQFTISHTYIRHLTAIKYINRSNWIIMATNSDVFLVNTCR